MATKKEKLGALIKAARTEAGFTQEQLAKKVDGLTASEISKAERGEGELTKEELKGIAKATGVTQKSLLDAAGYGTSSSQSSAKASSESKTGSKKTSSSSKTTSSGKTTSSSKNEYELTASEKKLIDLYRAADSDTKKAAVSVLKGEKTGTEDILTTLIGTAVDMFGKK